MLRYQIFSEDLPAIIFHCTEGEARNYGKAGRWALNGRAALSRKAGRFLHDCLADLAVWYESETLYNKQAIGSNLPGFQRVWASRKPGDPIPDKDVLHYKEFHAITSKWHKKVSEVRACLAGLFRSQLIIGM